jgi:peptide/nickel transport system substrate-binding protein
MPFSWHSENASLVHMELKFPKTIPELHANSYYGSINGIALPERALLIDDYSSSEFRIVHFVISRPILDMLSGKVPAGSTEMLFSLSPAGTPKFPIDVQSLPAGKYVFELSWGPRVIRTGVLTTFAMNLQDVKTGDLSRDTGFDFVLRHNGTEVFRQKEYSSIGVYSEQYTFQDTGLYQLSAENINGQGETSQLDLQVLQGNGTAGAPSPQSTSSAKPSGCLIATAAFGSELTPQVQYLRNFRDQFVMKSESGSAFMTSFNGVYYSFSPQVADYEREHPALQMTVRGLIYPLLGILVLSESAHHLVGGELGTMLAGGIAASIIGATYLWPAGAVIPYRAKSRWFVMSVIVATVIMAASLLVIPSMLVYTTAAFVVVTAASGAVLVPRTVKSILVK